jgi:hypothetical protein
MGSVRCASTAFKLALSNLQGLPLCHLELLLPVECLPLLLQALEARNLLQSLAHTVEQLACRILRLRVLPGLERSASDKE